MFLYQGGYLHKKKENGLTATSLLEIRTPEWSSVSTSRFRERTFFISRQNGTLSFFFGVVQFSQIKQNLKSTFSTSEGGK